MIAELFSASRKSDHKLVFDAWHEFCCYSGSCHEIIDKREGFATQAFLLTDAEYELLTEDAATFKFMYDIYVPGIALGLVRLSFLDLVSKGFQEGGVQGI